MRCGCGSRRSNRTNDLTGWDWKAVAYLITISDSFQKAMSVQARQLLNFRRAAGSLRRFRSAGAAAGPGQAPAFTAGVVAVGLALECRAVNLDTAHFEQVLHRHDKSGRCIPNVQFTSHGVVFASGWVLFEIGQEMGQIVKIVVF